MSRQRELQPILPAGHRSKGGHSTLPGSAPLMRQGSFPGLGPMAAVKPLGSPWLVRAPIWHCAAPRVSSVSRFPTRPICGRVW
jgi:hypothetical protein